MDFVSDALASGRKLRYLTVADDFTHECVDIAVDHGIGGLHVTRILDQAACFRGYPKAVCTDNGPGFTSRTFIAWTQRHGIRHLLIQPGWSIYAALIRGAGVEYIRIRSQEVGGDAPENSTARAPIIGPVTRALSLMYNLT